MVPEKPTPGPTSHLAPVAPQKSSRLSALGSRGQGSYTQPPTAAKPKRRWLPILAITAALVGGGAGVHYYTAGHGDSTPISTVATKAQQTLTLSGADLDEATTAAAVAAIHSRQNDNPLIARLTEQQKQEIITGERKFYKLPVIPTHIAQQAPSAPAAERHEGAAAPSQHDSAKTAKHTSTPARHTPRQQPTVLKPQVEQPTPSQAAPVDTGPQDRIQIILNGVIYATYNVTNGPLTLDAPLKMGDIWGVSCLELSVGKSSVTIGIANVLNPVQTTLSVGQSTTWTVGRITTAPDYAWFHTQAEGGNAVAEYGLGHMYEYGIGEPKDMAQAIRWYQQAADQNYLDAKQRLAELGQ